MSAGGVEGGLTSEIARLAGHDAAGKNRGEGDGEIRLKVEHQQTMAKHAKCGRRIYMVIRDLEKLAVHLLVSPEPLHRFT